VRTSNDLLDEIEVEAKKAADCLWHASAAIANRSPDRRDSELRRTLEHLSAILDLARRAR